MTYANRSAVHANRRWSPLFVAAITGVSAYAAVSSGWSATVEEITVTTRRSEENLQEVPVSVTALSADFIEKQGISTTADVVSLVPGVQFDQSFSAADTRISVRGINSERGRASAAVLVDGIDVSGENITAGGGSSLLNTRLLELERVEVIKGPQSALYGRNAFAGAINYITKQPSMDGFEGSVYADYGSHDTRGNVGEIRGRITGPLIEGKLAASLNVGYFEDTGSYVNNNPNVPAANVALNGSRSVGGRAMLLFTPTDDLSITGSVAVSNRKSDPRALVKVGNANTFYLNETVLPPGTMPDLTAFGMMNYGQWLGTVTDDSVTKDGLNLSLSGRTGQPFAGSEDDTVLASVKVEWDTDIGTFRSVTSYLDNEATLHEDSEYQDGLGTPFDLVLFGAPPGTIVNYSLDNDYLDETDTRQLSQEFVLQSDWDRGNWLVGVSYFDEAADNADFSDNYFNDTGNPANPFGLFIIDTAFMFPFTFCGTTPGTFSCGYAQSAATGMPPKTTERDTKSYSLFGLVGFDLTDRLRLTAEARYIKDKIRVTTNTAVDRVSQTILNIPIDLAGLSPVAITLPETDSQSSDTINPRLALDFSLNDDVLFYASAAKGTKPAGFGTVQFARPQAARVKQEKLYAFEVGTKTSWLDGALLANAALYYNEYKDRQVGVTITDPITGWAASGIVNAAKAETKGLEVDLTWRPTEPVTLGLAYAYTDADWKEFNYTDIRNEAAGMPVGPTGKDRAICGNAAGDCSGGNVAGIPEHALTLVANYTAPLNEEWEWFANVIGAYQDKRAVYDRVNTAFIDSHWNWDAQLGVQNDMWTVQVYVNNLLDDDTPRWGQGYQDFRDGMYGGQGGEPRDESVFAFLPPPRLIGLRVNYMF